MATTTDANSAMEADPTVPARQLTRIVTLGLDGAGKTTLLYSVAHQPDKVVPTTGWNVERLTYEGSDVEMWDVSGIAKERTNWKYHVRDSDTVAFVVDASDRSRIHEAATELRKLLQEDRQHRKLLIYANKQDKPDCMDISEIRAALELDQVTQNTTLIQPSSAVTGDGVREGFEWMCRT